MATIIQKQGRRGITARIGAAVAVAAVLLGGCATSSELASVADSAVVMPAAPVMPVPAPIAPGGDMVSGDFGYAAVTEETASGSPGFAYEGSSVVSNLESPQTSANREIIMTGSAEVYTDNPSATASAIAAYVESIGGTIASRREWRGSANSLGGASLSLRVPAGNLNSALDELSRFGEVRSISVDEWDVTAQGADLDARIAALQTSVTRLLELLATAGETGDLLQVERELSSRQAELDGLRAARSDLSERVAMSSLEVQILPSEVAQRTAEPRPGFLGGLERGWQAFRSFLSGFAVAIGAMLPFLIALGILAAILTPLIKWLRRRRSAATSASRIVMNPIRYQAPKPEESDSES